MKPVLRRPHSPPPPPPEDQDAAGDRRREHPTQLLERLLGKKVLLSTTDDHSMVGRFVALDADDHLRLRIAGRDVRVRRAGLAGMDQADPALAEYLK